MYIAVATSSYVRLVAGTVVDADSWPYVVMALLSGNPTNLLASNQAGQYYQTAEERTSSSSTDSSWLCMINDF